MAKHKQSALVESTPLKKRRRRTQQQSNSSQLLNSNSKTPSSSSSLNSPRGAVDVEAREARNMRKKKDKEWAAALKKIWQSNLLLEELGEKQGFWKHLDPNTRQKNYLLRFDSTQILKKWGKEFDRRGIDEIKVESFVIARDKLEKKIRKQTAQSALRIFPEKYARKLKEAFDKFPTNYQMFFKETLTVNVASAVIKEFYEQSQAGTNRLNQPTQDDNLVALSNDRSLANGQPLEIREDAQEELGVEENGEFAQDDMAPAENGGAAHEYQDVDVDEVQEIDNEIVQVEEIEDIDDDIQIIDPPPRRIFVAPIMPREQDMIPYGGYSPEELAPPVVEMDDEPPPVIQINRGFWHDDEEDLGVQGREDAPEELDVEENGEFAQDDMAPVENRGAAPEYQDVDVDEIQEIDNEIVQVEEIEDIDDDIQVIDPPPRRVFVAPIMPREQDMIPYGGYSPEELAPPVVEMDDEPPPVIQINRGFWHDDEEDLGVQGREDAQEELDVEENGEFAHDDMVLVENGGAAQGHQDVDVDEVQEIDDEVVQVEEIEDIDDDIQVIEPPPRQPVVIAPTMRLAPDVIPYGGYQPRELEQPPMEIDDRRFPVIQMDRGFGHDDDVEIVEEIRQDVPRRKEDVSPARHRSPSLVRYRTPSPARNMSPPVRTLTPSPTSAGQSTSSDASRTPSPICRRTRAQVRAPNPPPTRAGLSAAAQNNNGYTMAVNKQKCRLVVIPNKFINESPSDYDVIRQVSSMEYKQSQKGVGKQTHNEETHLYCVTCGKYFFPYCSEHPALFIQDSPILIKQVGVPRAIASIPAGFFSVRDSSIVGAGLGVFAERMIPKGYMFGPYEGVRINDGPEARKGAYAYHLKTKTDSYLIDAADAEKSNWMRYVNTPSGDAEQNLVAIQFNGNIYFKVIRPILPGQEAFVEYGEGYHLSFFSGS